MKNTTNDFHGTLVQTESLGLTHLVRGASGSFALKMLSTVLVFLTTLTLSRFLGPTGYGNYAFALAWISVLIYPALLGLNVLLTREVARYKAESDWSSLRGLLAWSDNVVVIISLGLALLGTVLLWFLKSHFNEQMQTTLWIAMTVLPFMCLVRLREGAIRGLDAVVLAQLPQFLIRPVLFLTFVLMVHFLVELTAPITMVIRAVATGTAFLFATVLLKKYLPRSTQTASTKYHPRRWLQSAFPLFAAGAAMMINEQISIILVGSIMGAEEAGVFDVARRGAMFIPLALIAFNMPLAPTVARLYALGQKESLQKAVTKCVRLSLLSALPVAFGLIFCGRWYLLFFGSEFTGGHIAVAILSAAHLLNVGIGSAALLLNMTGFERYTAIAVVISVMMNGTLNVALIPFWGIEGAAMANALSLTFFKTTLAVLVYKKLGIHCTAWA